MIEKLIQKFNRWLAIRRFIKRYRYLIEVNRLLEEYLTQQIINGGSDQFIQETRKQLLTNQNETKTHQAFLNYLKNI